MTTPEKRSRFRRLRLLPQRKLAILIAIIAIALVVGGTLAATMAFQATPQPSIQATGSNIPLPTANPKTSTVANNGRVSNSGSFNYTTTDQGLYALLWDNTFSTTSSKSVNATYNIDGSKFVKSFTVAAGQSQAYSYALPASTIIYGKFNVTGGSTNDIEFFIAETTCTSTVAFSFTLVNLGSANGLATIILTVDGMPQWTNKYYVPRGTQVPGTGNLLIPDCNPHVIRLAVSSQEKA